MASVIILGKGQSILRSTKSLVDSFDKVAICNRPIYDGYEHLISNHANFDFTSDFDYCTQYESSFYESLGIEERILTTTNSEIRNLFCGDGNITGDLEFDKFHELNPSTGLLAFYYFLQRDEYDHIGLIGFDFFKINEKKYYFKTEELNPNLRYLISNGTYDENLIYKKKSGHDTELSILWLVECFKKYKNKKFTFLGSLGEIEVPDNVEIL